MEGRLIGQYRVTGVLGEGGMGVVYAAEHTLLARPAAVKVLLPKLSDEPENVNRFFNEALAATAIRHPGIVEVYDFGWTAEGAAFIVMEHLQGETLRARHKHGPMRWSTALALARQIAGALGAAHAKGIIHRDLKPDNVFLVPDPEVPGGERIKLLDFGIAKLAGAVSSRHKTQTGALMGTPTYMAPEQCRGVAVDSRADLYALGCLLFELCTGRPPFDGEGAGDVLAAHIYLPPPAMASLASSVPQEVEALIRRLLAKSPLDRVQTAGELIRLMDAARTAIRQAARSGQRPVLPPVLSFADDPMVDDHSEPEGEDGPTEREHVLPQDSWGNTAGPELATEAQREAEIAAAPAISIASQLGTTLSGAVGTRPRTGTRVLARRPAILSSAGGLAILGAIALSFSLYRGGGGDALLESTTSSPSTELVPSTATAPTLEVTPPAPTAASPSAPADALAPAVTSTTSSPSLSPSGVSPPPTPVPHEHRGNARSSEASQQLPVTVRIVISSTPPGAAVLLGNVGVGQTPWVKDVERSDRMITFSLQHEGYRARVISITPTKALEHKVVLEKLPPTSHSSLPPAQLPQSSPPPPASAPSPRTTPPAAPPPQQSPPEYQGINPFTEN